MRYAVSMLGEKLDRSGKAEAYERVRGWVRARFALGKDSPILVSELQCRIPGCPPVETALAFWTADNQRRQFKLLKPLEEVGVSDIGWLIGGPRESETNYWDCC